MTVREAGEDTPRGAPSAEVRLRLSEGALSCWDSDGAIHGKVENLEHEVRCRVWANHSTEPDNIRVLVD